MVKKSLKRLVFLLVVTMAATMYSACGSKSTEESSPAKTNKTEEKVNWITAKDISNMPKTTIRYWYYESPERTELGKKQVAEFMKKFPNIVVEGKTAPEYTDNEMLLSYIKTRNNSNIQQSVNNEDLWYIDHKILYPLDNFPDYKVQLDRLNPDLNYTYKDGHVYSLSWYFEPRTMYYNKKMVVGAGLDPNTPPKTYSEFMKWAEALTKKDSSGKEVQWAIAPSVGEEWWRWEFVVQPFYIAANGSSQIVSDDGKKAAINNPGYLQSHQLFYDLFSKGYASKSSFKTNPFVAGQVAMALESPAMITNIKRNAPPDFEYFIGPVPKPDDSKVQGFPTFGFVRNFALIDEIGLPEGEEKDCVRRATWEFMKYLLSDEQMAADFQATGSLPPVKDVYANPAFAKIADSFGPALKQVIASSKEAYIGEMRTTLVCDIMALQQKAYLNIVYGKVKTEDAVKQLENDINKLIQEGRKN